MEQDFIEKNKYLKLLGERIRQFRQAKGISQEELAFKINSARNFIGCIERGEKSPSIYVLYKIATILDVSIDNLTKNF
mgnify:FL=1